MYFLRRLKRNAMNKNYYVLIDDNILYHPNFANNIKGDLYLQSLLLSVTESWPIPMLIVFFCKDLQN